VGINRETATMKTETWANENYVESKQTMFPWFREEYFKLQQRKSDEFLRAAKLVDKNLILGT
jgi:hypothetical protein